jgi:Helix-turn-helix domain
MQRRISVAELIDSDVSLRPDEAVAIVREICRQYAAGDLRGIPNPTVIRLTSEGTVVVEGPVSRDHSPVPAAAALLNQLLPPFGGANGFKVPGGLRLVLARATGTLDLQPFAGADDFRAALERFTAPDLAATVLGLFRAWAARREARAGMTSSELTVSDIRRARRATGLSLEDVSQASGIPSTALRELEWGYMRNWQAGDSGRDALRRYARAAGLDEDLVVSVAWPLIESEARNDEQVAEAWALVPSGPQALATLQETRRPYWRRLALASAAAMLFTVAAVSMRERPAMAPAISAPAVAPAPRPAQTAPALAPVGGVQPASYTGSGRPAIERPAPTRPRARATPTRATPTRATPTRATSTRATSTRATPTRPARSSRKSFFEKVLFRIEIR